MVKKIVSKSWSDGFNEYIKKEGRLQTLLIFLSRFTLFLNFYYIYAEQLFNI